MQNISVQSNIFQGGGLESDTQTNVSLLLSDGLARIIPLLENAQDKEQVHEVVYLLRQLGSSLNVDVSFTLLKTSKGFPLSMKVTTSTKQLKFLPTLIQVVHNTHWRCSFLIQFGFYPKIESGIILSDILEQKVAEGYFLSQKTIAGLLKGQSTPQVLEL